MEKRYIEPVFFIVTLLATIVVVFMLFRPFLYTLILASVIAYLTSGLFTRLLRILRSPSGTAAIMTLLVFVTLLVPLTLIGARVAFEASGMYTFISEQATQERLSGMLSGLQSALDEMLPGVTVDANRITSQLGSVFGWLVGNLGLLVGSFASLALNFLLLLFFYFYLIRDGNHMVERLKLISPMSSEHEDQIIARIGRAITSTVRGSLVLAILQGLVSGAGFLIFGVPNPALWGCIVVLAAFVPTIGTALVQIPAIIYLAATGHTTAAVGLGIWASLAVGMLDNLLGPKLMSRGMQMHPLVTLLAILGGVSFFGPVGVLIGPITVALLYALLDMYLALTQKS